MARRRELKFVAVAALLMGAAALARPQPAQAPRAQFGGCGVTPLDPCSVSDQIAEYSLMDIDTGQLPGILQQDATTATSLTTPGGGGVYTPNASLISSLDQQLFAQVNSQNASTLFPGFQPLPNYTLTAIQANTEAALQVASELQYVRQLLITLIEIEATKASEEMNERSQEVATSATHFNGGTTP